MKQLDVAVIKGKKRFRKGFIIAVVGLLINLLETWYFGWNRYAASPAEYAWDFTCVFIMMYGWYLVFSSKITVTLDLSDLENYDSVIDALYKNAKEKF